MPHSSSRHHPSSPGDPRPLWLGRWFTEARRSGFLALLTPEQWHTLSALLSFTTREGRHPFTLDHLSVALGVSRTEAEARLASLVTVAWQGQPLLRLEYDPAGGIAGAELAPIDLLAQVQGPPSPVSKVDRASEIEPASPELGRALQEIGLNPAQIAALVAQYPAERLHRQLAWLPARKAHNPAALFFRAVEGDWAAPKEPA